MLDFGARVSGETMTTYGTASGHEVALATEGTQGRDV
jgi:hypothetical protein